MQIWWPFATRSRMELHFMQIWWPFATRSRMEVHFMQIWWPFATRSRMELHFMQIWWLFATRSRMELQFHSAPGSKRSSDLHKMYQCRCMTKNSWWWAERLPKTCRVIIPIKLEFSVSVSFIHKVLTVLVYMPFDHLMWLVVWESFTAFGDHESLRLYIIYHLYLYITACVNMKRSLKQVPWFRFEPVLSDYWSGVYCYVSVCGQCC